MGSTSLSRGGIVAIVVPSRASFVAAYFGILYAGGTPSPLVPPILFQDLDQYVADLAGILQAASPQVVLTDPAVEPTVRKAVEASGTNATVIQPPTEDADLPPRSDLADLALLQFTSGSSGRPRGVQVSYDNLEDNIDIIRRWSGMSESGRLATWLPLYHDMGLIGALLSPVVSTMTGWMMRPEQFIGSPARWLEGFGRFGAEMTACPNFGFGYVAKRVRPEQLEGFDFSGWRLVIVGAERIDTGTMARFLDLTGPFGFRADAIVPAYGMAEATLAVTGGRDGEKARAVRLDWSSLTPAQPVKILEEAWIGDPATKTSGDWLVSCGRPHRGMALKICDDEGRELPEGHLGEIHVSGPSIAHGYRGGETSRSTSFEEDGLHTGDAAFMWRDEVYVLGRMGDSLKIKARNVYVEDLEARLWDLEGVPRGRCVVLASPAADGSRLIAIVESDSTEWAGDVARALRSQVGDEVHIAVMAGPRGTILRTSSGKPRRAIMWAQLVSGDLQAHTVGEWPAGVHIEDAGQPIEST